MRAITALLVLSLVLGCSMNVHAARPKFMEFGSLKSLKSLARFLLSGLETDYGLTSDQAAVVEAIYDLTGPAVEDAIQDDLASGELSKTVSEGLTGPEAEAFNLLNSLLIKVAAEGDIPAVESVLDAKADPNAAVDGVTALYEALQAGDGELVETLISKGADTNRPGPGGVTPLLLAISNYTEAVEPLLAAGADPNLADESGNTPLLAALEAGKPEVVSLLLDHGANVNLPGGEGYTPFQAILAEDTIDPDQVSEFIAHGADVNTPTPEGITPLELAAGNEEVIALLLAAGAAAGPELEDAVL